MRVRIMTLIAATVTALSLTATPAFAETSLTAAGSSFANKFLVACAAANPSFSLQYNPAGSGAGRTAFANGSVAFAASDAANTSISGWSGSRSGYSSVKWQYVPVVGGPIGIIYNIKGIGSGALKLDSVTLAKIFAGKITKWNDSAIKALQTAAIKAKLPSTSIRVVYRSSNSGTSENLTDYLKQTAGTVWTKAKNANIATGSPSGSMPAGSIGAANSQVLVSKVKSTVNAIGYADLSDAVNSSGKATVSVAMIKNANGEYVAPTSVAATKFLAQFSDAKYLNKTTGAVSLNFTSKIPGAYNLSLLTYAMVDKNSSNAQASNVEAFVKYLVDTCGPAKAAKLGYSPIAGSLKTEVLKLINLIRA